MVLSRWESPDTGADHVQERGPVPTKKFVGGGGVAISSPMIRVHPLASGRPQFGGGGFWFGRILRWIGVAMLVVVGLGAQDLRRILPAGSSREEVLEAYGWPSGQSKLGSKEILSYPQGRVVLEEGRVERIDFSLKQPWPPPRPRPDFSAPPAPKPVAPALTRYDEALAVATREDSRIIALFSGAEPTPAGRRFDEEVARHPDFLETFSNDHVLLHVDFSGRTTLPPAVLEQHTRLCTEWEVRSFPALLLLSPAGVPLGRVDLEKAPPEGDYRAWVTAGLIALQDKVDHPVVVAPKVAPKKVKTVATAKSDSVSAKSSALWTWLFSTRSVVAGALVLGLATAVVLLWLVWRNWAAKPRPSADGEMTQRISDAASGLPSQHELATWPRQRLAKLVAAYMEAEGYQAEIAPPGSDKDIVLRRAGGGRGQVVILCAGSEIGEVAVKPVREFLATMTLEGVDTGWFVAPAGFTAEAKGFATQHKIQLIDGPRLIEQLRDLPPLILPKVLAKSASK